MIPLDEDSKLLIDISRIWKSGEKQKAFDMLMGVLRKEPDNPILNSTAAEYLNESGKYQEADKYLQKALDHEPEGMMNPFIHIKKAEILAERGLIHEAVAHVLETIKRNLREFLTIQTGAALLREYGLLDEAEKVYLRGLEVMPKHEQFWKDYALMYKEAYMLDKYLEVLQKGVEDRKRDTFLWSELGQTAAYLGKKELALDSLDNTKKFVKDNPEGHVTLGLTYAALEDYGKAKEHLEIALNQDKNDQRTWVHLARVLKLQGDKKGAEKAYNNAEKVDKSKKDLIKVMKDAPPIKSYELLYCKDIEDKFKLVLSALKKDPKSQEEITNLAATIGFVHKTSKGDWLINKSLDLIEDEDQRKLYLTLLGITLHTVEDHKKAIGAMYIATGLYPDSSTLWKNLGSILVGLNKLHGARAARIKQYNLDKSDTTRTEIGLISTQLKTFDEALAYLDENTSDPNELKALAICQVFTKSFEKAKKSCLKLIELQGDRISGYGYLALAEAGLGNMSASNEALHQLKKLNMQAAKEFERARKQATKDN